MTLITQKIQFDGRVQGVGFRYCVKEIAKGYEVTGSVKNLITGQVELLVHGNADEIEAFIVAIHQSELAPHIKDTVQLPVSKDISVPNNFQIL